MLHAEGRKLKQARRAKSLNYPGCALIRGGSGDGYEELGSDCGYEQEASNRPPKRLRRVATKALLEGSWDLIDGHFYLGL